MSVYTFRVWFSGLVHFVPNKNPHAKCQLCAVLPKTDGKNKHVGVIYEADWEIRCGRRRLTPGCEIVKLEDRRITFDISRVDDLPPLSFGHLAPGVLSMDDIAGIFTDEDEAIVSANPPRDRVLAQILFGMGYLMSIDPEVSIGRTWTIPATLTGSELSVTLYDPIYIDIPSVEKVTLISKPLEAGIDYQRELRPNDSGLIEIFVSHRCEGRVALSPDDVDPRCTPNSFVLMQLDRDFAFNYKLLQPSTLDGIKKTLSKMTGIPPNQVQLPVPESPLLEFYLAPHICCDCSTCKKKPRGMGKKHDRKLWSRSMNLIHRIQNRGWGKWLLQILLDFIATGTGTGSGSDCLGGTSQARFFSLDQFVPGPEPAVDMALLHSMHRLEKERAALRPIPTNESGSASGSFPKL